MRIAIAIPVYKEVMTDDERRSLQQCVSVLRTYDTFLVCPEEMDTKTYDAAAGRGMASRRFDPHFFEGLAGYNELMMSSAFYDAFADYDYLLIYQLDAWVFSDELTHWCSLGYDYVGAPWFEGNGSHGEGCRLWCVGNGGLSLRRLEKFRQLTRLKPYTKVKTCREVFRDEYHGVHDLGRCLVRCLGPWIGTNSIRHVRKNEQEDLYFCVALRGTRFQLRVPTPEEAARFAFERSPQYLYEEVTQRRLPFGCHAWRRYRYADFWKTFIPALD